MRLAISHLVTCRFTGTASGAMQTLRMEPRGLAGQFVERWRIDVSADCLLKPVNDPYGNTTYSFAVTGPLETVTVQASGTVSTEDTVGVVKGLSERLPHALYLRDTALTRPTDAIRAIAATIATAGATPLERLHALMHHLADTLDITASTVPAAPCRHVALPSAGAALAAGRADDIDAAHIFVAAARALALPARLVTGYVLDPDRPQPAAAVAVWAEAWVDAIGWIGFDVPRRTCPTETHVRLAAGPDLHDAQPLRLAAYGADLAEVTTAITVTERPKW